MVGDETDIYGFASCGSQPYKELSSSNQRKGIAKITQGIKGCCLLFVDDKGRAVGTTESGQFQ